MTGYITSFIVVLVIGLLFGTLAYELGKFSAVIQPKQVIDKSLRVEHSTKR